MKKVKKRKPKRQASTKIGHAEGPLKAAPGITVLGGHEKPKEKGPAGMPTSEIEYRTLLQEAIFWVTKQVIEEQRSTILMRAEDRVKTLMELRS